MSVQEISKYITIIRPEFMAFCKDACRAAALNHLLFRIAYKCKGQPKEKIQAGEVLWYAKTELLVSEMSDAWGVCKVRKEINGLIDMGLFGKENNPTWGADRTKHFCFGSKQCQVFINLCEQHNICIVHLGLPAEVVHLIYSSNANDKSIKCSCSEGENVEANDKFIGCKSYKHQMETIDISDANDKSIEAITKITTKITTKDNNQEESTYTDDLRNTNSSASANASLSHAPNASLSDDWLAKEEAHEQHPHTNSHGAGTDAGSHHPTRNQAQARAAGVRERNTPFGATHSRNTANPGELADDANVYTNSYNADGSVYSARDFEQAPEQQNMLMAAPTKPAARKEPRATKAEQMGLPLQVELGPLVMPDASAAWNVRTVVLISEVLRQKRYTPMQRANQENSAKRMLKDFPEMTRAQFEEIFADWAKWWREHDKGYFTIADLLVKGKNNEIRLQTALDRLEAQKASSKAGQSQKPASQPQHVRASSPNTSGYTPLTPEEIQRNKDRAHARRAAKLAAQ